MAEVAPAPAPAPAASTKTARKRTANKRQNTGPSVGEKIVKIVAACKERNGMSLAAVKKALAAGGYDVEKNGARIRQAIKNLVTKGILIQTKGTGASGSFKVGKKTPTESKHPKTPRKVGTKNRKAATKKPSPKKPGVKKPAKKSTAGKSKGPKNVKSRSGATKKSAGKSAAKGKAKVKPATKPSAAKSKSSRAKASSGKKSGKK